MLIILVLLLLVATYFIFSKSKSTLRPTDVDFALQDTTGITRIQISKGQDSICLEKMQGHWQFKAHTIASQARMHELLEVLERLSLQAPVAKSQNDLLVQKMKQEGTHVEIFKQQECVKSFWLLADDKKNLSYGKLAATQQCYILHAIGYQGTLTSFFSTEAKAWRSSILFSYTAEEIQGVEIIYDGKPENSFSLHKNEGKCVLNGTRATNDKASVYFHQFVKLPFLASPDLSPEEQKAIQKLAFATLRIQTREGQSSWKLYRKPAQNQTDPFDFDIFAIQNDKGEWFYAQYFNFDPILKEHSDFQ